MLAMAFRRKSREEKPAAVISPPAGLREDPGRFFSFDLTPGQRRAVDELIHDFSRGRAMNRLLLGDVGCGNVAKLVNNMISLAINSISAEGFVLGTKAGIDPQTLLDIISTSTGDNWCARQYPRTTFQGNFEPGFKIGLAYKDIGLALDLGKDYKVPLPIGIAVKKDLEETIAAGLIDKGVDAVILPLEKATGIKVRTSKKHTNFLV
jgi:3-hydroxyisobutyrate dehydrogenase-like beta-hydroxyacid dehydrogenase